MGMVSARAAIGLRLGFRLTALVLASAPLWLASATVAQQVPDSTFDTKVAHPALTTLRPVVLFDEAHHNFHNASGRYLTFARLMTADGCKVQRHRARFTAKSLAAGRILVISNALGAEDVDDSRVANSAFTPEECDAVRDWVRAGGALLLIADHMPMGSAARELAARFGVDMRNGITVDTVAAHHAANNMSLIIHSRANGQLADHPITHGRDTTERMSTVLAFGGQSLSGPPDAVSFMPLAPTALDLIAPTVQAAMHMTADQAVSAAGRSQGLAFPFGKGRVVVLGEAAMLSAQLVGPDRSPMGMNVPGNDNRQLALNIVRWLVGALN